MFRLLHWALWRPLPNGDLENLDISQFTTQEVIADFIMTRDDNESGVFKEYDLEDSVEICRKKNKKLSIVPLSSKNRPRSVYTLYE